MIDQLDRSHPRSALVEERSAARVLAECARSGELAKPEAGRFLEKYPSSVYSDRVWRACGLERAGVPDSAADVRASLRAVGGDLDIGLGSSALSWEEMNVEASWPASLERLEALERVGALHLTRIDHAEFEHIHVIDVVENPQLSVASLAQIPAFTRTIEGNADAPAPSPSPAP